MKLSAFCRVILGACAMLSACQPPASDNPAARAPGGPLATRPSIPIDSPDTRQSLWSRSRDTQRLLYGKPGKAPLLALGCTGKGAQRMLVITRYAAADPDAKAIMALIGNGHRARLPIEAVWNGKAWLWEARYPARLPDFEVFTGLRAVEMTIPGAGTMVLNPAALPGQFVEQCRAGQPAARLPS